jgi:hypothetical protein
MTWGRRHCRRPTWWQGLTGTGRALVLALLATLLVAIGRSTQVGCARRAAGVRFERGIEARYGAADGGSDLASVGIVDTIAR